MRVVPVWAGQIQVGRALARPTTSDCVTHEGVKLQAISALKVSSLLGAFSQAPPITKTCFFTLHTMLWVFYNLLRFKD